MCDWCPKGHPPNLSANRSSEQGKLSWLYVSRRLTGGAKRLEHLLCKQGVVGSSPISSTTVTSAFVSWRVRWLCSEAKLTATDLQPGSRIYTWELTVTPNPQIAGGRLGW